MQRFMLKSKVHRVRVTGSELHYEGSLSLDVALMEAADLLPFEKIEVYNVSNGARFSTYVIPAPRYSGEVRLNGAAARLGAAGDIIIIASYALYGERELEEYRPYLVYVDEYNQIREVRRDMVIEGVGSTYDW
ncbi:MAG: aspartate 1-decarboxylase [Aquificaceae bacterium]|nr:aspartate 1-decarboxylase [Aquificaceae bacterium]MCS7195900.1 aspartate 1-decarboxylase [Aquificaceae bacterium]MCX7989630.1 aspartate 1-decarboxylase [Aquificaceae bacterium]MDW8033097.1 aspartate 1-decarboxylase [Aquificaceae bacterium]MDW8294810.1 aspartate 1-decarboxylase [Aquificaceae bacterium]